MLKRLLIILSFVLIPLYVFASSLSIAPVHIHFAPGEKIETVIFKNKGDDPVTLQTQVFQWSQKNGQNIYTPTKDMITSPAMFKIAPGQKQLLRIALRNVSVATSSQQQTYRIFLTQILPVKIKQTAPEQVNTKLKISLPIFIDLDPKIEVVKLTANRTNKGVQLVNAGNVTRLINQVRWMKDDGVTPISNLQDVFIYLLPGSSYTLPYGARSNTLQILTNRKLELLKLS